MKSCPSQPMEHGPTIKGDNQTSIIKLDTSQQSNMLTTILLVFSYFRHTTHCPDMFRWRGIGMYIEYNASKAISR